MASNTTYLELPVTFEWAKVFSENRDKTGPNNAYEGFGGAYTVDCIMSKEVFQQLEDAGSQKTPSVQNKDGKWLGERQWKTKEQGISYVDALDNATEVKVKLMRKHEAPFTYGGPPQVAHADGTPWDINDDGLIGNGSKGIAYVSVYQAGGLMGTRLDGIQVMELVEPPARDSDDDYVPQFRIPNRTGQTTAPKAQEPAGKVKKEPAKKPALEDDLNDILPF